MDCHAKTNGILWLACHGPSGTAGASTPSSFSFFSISRRRRRYKCCMAMTPSPTPTGILYHIFFFLVFSSVCCFSCSCCPSLLSVVKHRFFCFCVLLLSQLATSNVV